VKRRIRGGSKIGTLGGRPPKIPKGPKQKDVAFAEGFTGRWLETASKLGNKNRAAGQRAADRYQKSWRLANRHGRQKKTLAVAESITEPFSTSESCAWPPENNILEQLARRAALANRWVLRLAVKRIAVQRPKE
jgi:hypothetical protein